MKPLDLLLAAKQKIEDPAHWTQGAYARDDIGMKVDECSPRACRWCSMGALYAASGGATLAVIQDVDDAVSILQASSPGNMGVVRTNDQRGHPAVMEMFDRAIERARQMEQPS